MKRATIVNLNKSKFVNVISKNNIVIIMAIFYALGILFGVLWLKNSQSILEIARQSFSDYLAARENKGMFSVFLSSFMGTLPIALLLFLCGTSIVGIVLTPLAVCYRGFEYGVLSGFLYTTFSLQGIAFNSLILIPCTILAVFGYIISGREALKFSLKLAKISMPKGQAANLYSDFKTYCKIFILILILFVFSALLDAIMSVSFLKFFNF